MAYQYVLVPRKNPARREEPAKYYAQARSGKKVDISTICKRVNQRSSYSVGELEGTIGEFLVEIQNVLEEGNIVQLGRLGNFRLTIQTSQGTDTPKEFTTANIKGCRVRFHASAGLQAMCKSMKYSLHTKDKGIVDDPSDE